MVGMELQVPGAAIVERCLEKGAVINCTHDTVLRFVPPLVVEESEIDGLITILDEVLQEKES
jgi:acetylornithine/succinyldiaminopimelate/putrescine aminotransferase